MNADSAAALTAWSTLGTAVVAGGALLVAWWQLRNLNKTLRVNSLTARLQVEAEINARKEKVDEVTEETVRLDKKSTTYERDRDIIKAKLNSRLENWFNAVDRLAFCILKNFVPEKDWRAEYRDYLAGIIAQHPDFFSAASRYRNILDLHHDWQRK